MIDASSIVSIIGELLYEIKGKVKSIDLKLNKISLFNTPKLEPISWQD